MVKDDAIDSDANANPGTETIVGVLLAAGTGSRFDDGNKLLADVAGEPIVRRAGRTLAKAPVDRTIAVVGYEGDRVRDALDGVVDRVVNNPDYEAGQSESVRRGVRAARETGADAIVFLPGDLPCVDPDTVATLLAAFRESDADIVVPVIDGDRGNPVVFGESLFNALASVSGDVGGRALFAERAVRRVTVDDRGVLRDVDTVADLRELER